MGEFASTQNTGNLAEYIKGIPARGVPPKITIQHLASLGFKSPNDRPIVTVLKFVGVADSNGTPSEIYKKMRNASAGPSVLAEQIRQSYSGLFALYPDANAKDEQTLQDYFASQTDVGAASLKNIIKTFQALCSCAKFDGAVPPDTHIPTHIPAHTPAIHPPSNVHLGGRGASKTEVHFDIQVHIPGDQKPEVYEAIFKNLGKYVLGIKDE
jgi:hypothetical protein